MRDWIQRCRMVLSRKSCAPTVALPQLRFDSARSGATTIQTLLTGLAHRYAALGQIGFDLRNAVFTKVKNTGRQHRISFTLQNSFSQMLKITHTTGGDDWNTHCLANGTGYFKVKPGFHTVAVH